MADHLAHNQEAVGSTPTAATLGSLTGHDAILNLRELAKKHGAHKSGPDYDYLDIYEREFCTLRDRDLDGILEIGIGEGGSLRMWAAWFPGTRIVGIDNDPATLFPPEGTIQTMLGSQSKVEGLEKIGEESGPFDIIIDDGSHLMVDQQTSLCRLFPFVAPGGVYVIEDLHTSYWPEYGGNFEGPRTTVAMLKALITSLHHAAVQSKRAARYVPPRARKQALLRGEEIESINFYRSIAFIWKSAIASKPSAVNVGGW